MGGIMVPAELPASIVHSILLLARPVSSGGSFFAKKTAKHRLRRLNFGK